MSDVRDRVLREARRHFGDDAGRRVDWSAVEQGLFARVAREQRERRDSLAPAGRRRWAAAAGAVAAAAALVVFARAQRPASFEPEGAGPDAEAARLVSIGAPGAVLVDGRLASVGTALHVGDAVETQGGRAVFRRPGRLVFAVEPGSTLTVTRARASLVVALSRGAVDAEVVPVARGEAFAIDTGRSRVAVHGTRLRVERTGDRVVIDLHDGVVSVGDAPRVGLTLGALVSAPAHAEFTDTDAQGTLRISHDPASVRARAPLEPAGESPAAPSSPSLPAPPEAAAAHAESSTALPGLPRVEPRPTADTAATPASVRAGDPNAQADVAAAVRACMAELLHADDVTIVVSTTLSLDVRDDGSVRTARFDPPVAPDVNACAAKSIYKTRFTHGGPVVVPVSFKN